MACVLGLVQTLRALLPRSNARLLPVLQEDAESSEAWGAPEGAPCAAEAESSSSEAIMQATASREGSPVHALLSSIGIQVPTGEYQEGGWPGTHSAFHSSELSSCILLASDYVLHGLQVLKVALSGGLQYEWSSIGLGGM